MRLPQREQGPKVRGSWASEWFARFGVQDASKFRMLQSSTCFRVQDASV